MERVSVVGLAGSGKTTLARRLSQIIDVPHVELDALVWSGAPWERTTQDLLRARFEQACDQPSWVIDGYYGGLTESIVWPRADTVVWLDLPRRVVLARAGTRSLRRIVRRERLWGGNRESIRDLLSWSPERSVLRWIWVQHPTRRAQLHTASLDPQWSAIDFLRLRSRHEVDAWLSALGARR